MLKMVTILYYEQQRSSFSVMNDKKGNNIVNDKITALLITRTAYLLTLVSIILKPNLAVTGYTF